MKASAVLSLVALAGLTIAAPTVVDNVHGSGNIHKRGGGWEEKPNAVAVEAVVPVAQEHWHKPQPVPVKSNEYSKEAGKKWGKEGGSAGEEDYKSVQDNESASFSKSFGETTDHKTGKNWGKEGGEEKEKEQGKSQQ
ncbi:hypothetical protein BO83DRAFT_418087 [Aspergillus eucalypticola CBS 122712]|uniref:Uncharacterized protein n=1 Tax=Aspergillus eucalypticola (strain CBS 122712 / IBT 29274) TaxID=1448314 RepID=A0A317VBK5_ASPEC|nr:uncharacterized protein BO83DRAFT_418087 [Aspergillus eucalypticola CBS 122712]PWY70631.1 hypothetical protein BO83DRAFT_418087 [Aspergillus eucalypticola CBS 122712]